MEYIQNYNFNSLYICLLLLLYNISISKYEYINILLNKVYLLNYMSILIIINVIGVIIFLHLWRFKTPILIKIKNLFFICF